MPSGTIWHDFLPKLARFAPASPGGAAPRRHRVARGDRSCEVRSPEDPLMTPPRAAGEPGANLGSFGKQFGPNGARWHNYGARWHNYGARWQKCILLKANGIDFYCI